MIELADFCKTYTAGKKTCRAADHVSFTARDGSVTALLGPNGAGKTTILKAVCAVHYADEGHVYVYGNAGDRYDAAEESAAVKQITGFVPEISSLPKDMTCAELLDERAQMLGFSGKEKDKAVARASESCSIGSVFTEKTGKLSKGFCQRVSFSLALLGDPQNLVLDEPVSGLDPAQIAQIRQIVKQAAQTKAVLLSTHLMQEVSALCSHVIILSHGKVAADGTEESVRRSCGAADIEAAFMKLTGGGNE